MVPGRQQRMAPREERFPTEWAMCDGDRYGGGQASRQSEAAWPAGWAPDSPEKTTGRPAREETGSTERLRRRVAGPGGSMKHAGNYVSSAAEFAAASLRGSDKPAGLAGVTCRGSALVSDQ